MASDPDNQDVKFYKEALEREEHWNPPKNVSLPHENRIAEDSFQKKRKNENTEVAKNDEIFNHSYVVDNPPKKVKTEGKYENQSELSSTSKRILSNLSSSFISTSDPGLSKNLSKAAVAPSLKIKNTTFSDFVLLFHEFESPESPESIILGSADLNNKKLIWSWEKISRGLSSWSLSLNKQFLASESGNNRNKVMKLVYQIALDKLKEDCYGIKVKDKIFFNVNVNRSILERGYTSAAQSTAGVPREETNQTKYTGKAKIKGGSQKERKKMIRQQRAARDAEIVSLKRNVKNYLDNWLKDSRNQNLIFSSEFDIRERETMHQEARKLPLITKICEKNGHHHLVMFKKFSPFEVVEKLKATGGKSDKYELINPSKP